MPDTAVRADLPAVVITRPAAQSVLLAQQVRQIGREVVILPLLEIAPLSQAQEIAQLQQHLARLSEFALVAFVSANAIDACFAMLRQMGLSWPCSVPIGVMGEGSRAALLEQTAGAAGLQVFCPQDVRRSDSETLLPQLDLPQLAQTGKPVLIMRGQHGREFLADALRNQGLPVRQLACYQRITPALTLAMQQQLTALLQRPHDWCITSSEALRHLLDLLAQMDAQSDSQSHARPDAQPVAGTNPQLRQNPEFVARMRRQHLIVPHLRIAETATSLGFSDITQSAAGDAGLLAALQSNL